MVILTEEEKQEMCIELADHLPKIRELLKLSQKVCYSLQPKDKRILFY